jgi:hypothetical protein
MISHFAAVVHNSNRILHAAAIMDMPVFATEQYPKVLDSVSDLETRWCVVRMRNNGSKSHSMWIHADPGFQLQENRKRCPDFKPNVGEKNTNVFRVVSGI